MTIKRVKAIAYVISAIVILLVAQVYHSAHLAIAAPAKGVKNIVLVHGAWADGSSWSKVIPLLQADGYTVTAVQNPLTSLSDDVAATKRVIDAQDGPVLLVGHSWAGAVITQAGTDPKVAGLVYVNAFAPDQGQAVGELGKGYPTPPGLGAVKQVGAFLWVSPAGIADFFAPDLPRSESAVLAATQGPIASATFTQKVSSAAWRTKPSWCVVGSQDKMIDPSLERAMAKKIKAKKTLELASSHVSMLSHPDQVASFIASAASSL
ncbi:MAG: alpha/beta hydrolase [Candidatus Eremiobacteraeota bacterium]|nr:alpha/beta hydrolase [Candidatus Eremiobacteraeota bacterium]MBV8203782.1 alpha/beta hydrolase [Candidatus Eremiobacteraeota bacterium]MBV8339478.1 alpha/beta hydrolase [Candidatus Eremiobacteraeota bacterium]MBV8459377.1 alpha/beta hydrolase [Candidatus Eremiobacteraeota bacterium]MBV8596095.1 alpha/beta hydrolase [Candidatus Eremiobacteraeota bacterium]